MRRTLALTLIALAGCGSSAGPTCPAAPYQDPGPWAAGVTTLDVDGIPTEVWYPADRDAIGDTAPDVYDTRDFLPPDMRGAVPADAPTTFTTDAYRDVPIARGEQRFPIVYFSHGLGGFRSQSTAITTHLAQWGYIVAAPEHVERDMAAVLSGAMLGDAAFTQITAAHARLADEDRAGRFAGRLDLDRVAVMGHSAGGGAIQGLADESDLGVDAWIGMATVTAPRSSTAPGLLLGGTLDGLATASSMANLYENQVVASPARFVEIRDAGHLAFSDLCAIGRDEGGILRIAQRAGLEIPDLVVQLASDGCTEEYLPAEEAWPVIRHYAVAHLRASIGAADGATTSDGLGSESSACFEPALVDRLSSR